jgi:large subunit ribosomal protein L15
MKLNEILTAAGHHKKRMRVGRGTGSGKGKTSGRGTKGMGARAGARLRFNYEGGQNPLLARIPKRGFNNYNFRVEYQVVNVGDLERFEAGATIDPGTLAKANLIGDSVKPVKILADGDVTKKFTVVANKFSAVAIEKINKAGGQAQEPGGVPAKAPVVKAPVAKAPVVAAAPAEKAPQEKAKADKASAKKAKAPKPAAPTGEGAAGDAK